MDNFKFWHGLRLSYFFELLGLCGWHLSICHDIIMIATTDLKFFISCLSVNHYSSSKFCWSSLVFRSILVLKQSKDKFSFDLIFDEAK